MQEKTDQVLIIGGGPAGMEAALRIAEARGGAVLVEREQALGGNLLRLSQSFPYREDPRELVAARAARLEELQVVGRVRVIRGAIVASARRSPHGFSVDLFPSGGEWVSDAVAGPRTIDAAAVVLATGFDLIDAARFGEYGYGVYPGVVTALEFEDTLRSWRTEPSQGPRGVAFIKCVGSRDKVKGYPYCSKICCMYTAKQAGAVKEIFPETDCYVFYMDYRAAGKGYEEFVREVIEDRKVQYVRGRPSRVLLSGGRLLVRAEDTLMGVPVEVDVDMVVLATAVVPSKETVALANMFDADLDEYGYLKTRGHDAARSGDRVFVAGAACYPVSIGEAQQQGAAAAAEVLSFLNGHGDSSTSSGAA